METELHDRLGALAHPKRLQLFRLLVRRYPDAVPAGQIAVALGLKPNTASHYLSALRHAGLIEQDRAGTSLRYRAGLPGIRNLVDTLLGDCCRNRPDLCTPFHDPVSMGEPAVTNADKTFNALFICTGNSARSLMAETILRSEGEGRFNAYSAGTAPSDGPNPQVLELLESKGHDISPLRSKSLDEFERPDAPEMDFVFTVCDTAANEPCPVWPGHTLSAHWGMVDPTRAVGTPAQRKLALQQAYGTLRNRIAAFCSLPLASLDRISLQHRMDDIGRMEDAGD